jgi:uncharacterized membrane protein YeaQ/YmgE (transglycosylase-associated protein family)
MAARKTRVNEVKQGEILTSRSGNLPLDLKSIALLCGLGLAAGWFASLFLGGSGLLRYLVTGVLGAYVAEIVTHVSGWRLVVGPPLLSRIISATLGAAAVILLARLLA